jgi:ribosomal protein S28E/S33
MHFTQVLADLLASGQTVRFTAPGRSMHAVIRHGDVLLVAALERPVQIGDILLYRDAAGRPVAHRLIDRKPDDDGPALVLKGDSAAGPDLPVRPAQVLGRVFAVERGGRRIDPYGTRAAFHGFASSVASLIRCGFLYSRNRVRWMARRVAS